MILDDIMCKRREQLAREMEQVPLASMIAQAQECTRPVLDFPAALRKPGLSVIAEIKKASPSKGLICPDFAPVQTAKAYEAAGADAISCLTEAHYFQGGSAYFKQVRAATSLPMLRKDFIFHPYQIYEARVLGADAVLLICALLDTEKLHALMQLAESLGLHTLVEVHNAEELASAVSLRAPVIGVNNRDLKTFAVDLATTARLSAQIPYAHTLVSESGIATNADMRAARGHGADAVLIGETLMRAPDIGLVLTALREGVCS